MNTKTEGNTFTKKIGQTVYVVRYHFNEDASAIMYFGINDSKEFANKCSMELLEEKTFFPEALKMLGKKLSFVTKVSMKVAEKKKQVIILRLKLN